MPPDVAQRYEVRYPVRPWSLNDERRSDWHVHRRRTAQWRKDFAVLARAAGLPRLDVVAVHAWPAHARGVLPDTAACVGPVKAAIDGLVDAGVLPGDTGRHVTSITFHPPVRAPDALRLVLVPLLIPDRRTP